MAFLFLPHEQSVPLRKFESGYCGFLIRLFHRGFAASCRCHHSGSTLKRRTFFPSRGYYSDLQTKSYYPMLEVALVNVAKFQYGTQKSEKKHFFNKSKKKTEKCVLHLQRVQLDE